MTQFPNHHCHPAFVHPFIYRGHTNTHWAITSLALSCLAIHPHNTCSWATRQSYPPQLSRFLGMPLRSLNKHTPQVQTSPYKIVLWEAFCILYCIIHTYKNQTSSAWIVSLFKHLSGMFIVLDLAGRYNDSTLAFAKVECFVWSTPDHNHIPVATESIHPGKCYLYQIRKHNMTDAKLPHLSYLGPKNACQLGLHCNA